MRPQEAFVSWEWDVGEYVGGMSSNFQEYVKVQRCAAPSVPIHSIINPRLPDPNAEPQIPTLQVVARVYTVGNAQVRVV